MKKRLMFIVPPNVPCSALMEEKKTVFSAKIKKEIPLGILCMASYVKKYNEVDDIHILDFNVILYERIQEQKFKDKFGLKRYIQAVVEEYAYRKFDFVGIAAMFNNTYEYLSWISQAVRLAFPCAIIAAGGGVASNMPQEVFESSPDIDLIFYGEGEIGLQGLLCSKDEDDYIKRATSIITREKLRSGEKASFEFLKNLDDIPILDFDLLDFYKYNAHYHTQDEKSISAIPLMFSRGCPFKCCFCSAHSIHGRTVRYHSLERIKEDINKYVEKYGINTISIFDDNFFVDKEQAIELLNYFKNLNLNLEFVNGYPVYRVDDEMADCLFSAGVEVVTLAIESASDKVLRNIIHKPLRLDMVTAAIDCLHRHGFYVKGLFVIGFPGETLDDIKITMDFIHNSELDWVDIFIASPLPGSELLEICVKEGYVKSRSSVLEANFWHGSIETEEFDAKTLEWIQQYNTIKKDYVNNRDMQLGNWSRAYHNFQYVIDAGHDNPFAYYYASIALKKMGNSLLGESYYCKFKKIIDNSNEWRQLFEMLCS